MKSLLCSCIFSIIWLSTNCQVFQPINKDLVNVKIYDKEDYGYILGEEYLTLIIEELAYDSRQEFYKISGYIREDYGRNTNNHNIDILIYNKEYEHTNTDSLLFGKDSILVNNRLIGARFGYFTVYIKKSEIAEIVSSATRFKGFISIKEE